MGRMLRDSLDARFILEGIGDSFLADTIRRPELEGNAVFSAVFTGIFVPLPLAGLAATSYAQWLVRVSLCVLPRSA
jgi:hypothetical protein